MEVIEELSAVDGASLVVPSFKLFVDTFALLLDLLDTLREWVSIVSDGALLVDLEGFPLGIFVVTFEVKK